MLLRVARMYKIKQALRLEGMPVAQIGLDKVMKKLAAADMYRRDAHINVSRREQ
jgi:hypothetical protein